MREIILEAKANRNQAFLKLLIDKAVNSSRLYELVKASDAVMPCPSSLWSRVWGKLDIAGILAQAICQKYSKEYLCAPYHMGFNWQKRSRKKSRAPEDKEAFTSQYRYPLAKEIQSVLLIDDVMTSGHTLAKVGSSIQSAKVNYFSLSKTASPCNDYYPKRIPH